MLLRNQKYHLILKISLKYYPEILYSQNKRLSLVMGKLEEASQDFLVSAVKKGKRLSKYIRFEAEDGLERCSQERMGNPRRTERQASRSLSVIRYGA